MKKSVLIIMFLFLVSGIIAQNTKTEIQKLETLCKVWGFLKYYHPEVAKGKYDWDSQLMEKIPLIKAANSKERINEIYLDWINSLGKVPHRNRKNNIPDSLKYNLNLAWINDSSAFINEVISMLNYIKENRSSHNFYSKGSLTIPLFKNEKIYKDSMLPGEGLRLVGLFRYWNIINYFFPYKYKTDEDWNDVLSEMIPRFQYPKDTIDYHLAMLELTTKIDDSHAYFYSKYTVKYFGIFIPPFKYKIIDNKVVVTGFWNDTLAQKDDIQIGDVIHKINDNTIADMVQWKKKYVCASNESVKIRNLNYELLRNTRDTIKISFERNGKYNDKVIKLYKAYEFHYNWKLNNNEVCKDLSDSIGYVNMGVLKKQQADSVMKIMMNKKAIIFDIRNYPQGTLFHVSSYLNKKIMPFVKFTRQDFSYPGIYKWSQQYYTGKKRTLFRWYAYNNKGKENKNYYKGKVILLFNEDTQSHAEFTCMALQTAPNVKCIGSQTAGADGNVCTITFPGNINTCMTGLGVYYPDGKETQRIGIVPDIEVKPTIEGIKNKKDEVLERAIQFINTGK
jgi:carboxyl-terminal processing protease